MVVYEQHSLRTTSGAEQRRLNYVPDANTADCSVPLASSIHLSASLKIPLMRYGICIRSHFEYDALSSRKRDRHSSLPLPFSLFSHPVASRFRAFPSFIPLATPIDALLWRLRNRSTIESRSGRIYTIRSSRNNTTRIHDFSANKRARIVPIDWFVITWI